MSEANNISVRIKNKFNPISVWDTTLSDHILLSGEIAYAQTDGSFKIKIGDGVSPYNELPYFTNAVNISEAKYAQLIDEDAVDPDIIYIVSADYINAYGQQMKNLADGTDLSDAVTYGQLSTATSEVKDWVGSQGYISSVPTDLSSFTNSPGYLQASAFLSVQNPSYTVNSLADTMIQILNILRNQK